MRSQGPKAQRTEKIVLLGSQSTGKTSIVTRLVSNTFNSSTASTIGASFNSMTLMLEESYLKIDIWDTAGSEKFKSLTPMYYRDARAAIVVIDLTRLETLQAAGDWIMELRENGKNDCIIVLAANKCDLDDKRLISAEDINEFIFANQVAFWKETSALSGTGINELINETGKLLLKMPAIKTQEDAALVGLVDDINVGNVAPAKESGGCC